MTVRPAHITDDAYQTTQDQVELISRLLLSLDGDTLDAFIERADLSLNIAPIIHPSEWQAGVRQLQQVIACARAVRDAHARIEAIAR